MEVDPLDFYEETVMADNFTHFNENGLLHYIGLNSGDIEYRTYFSEKGASYCTLTVRGLDEDNSIDVFSTIMNNYDFDERYDIKLRPEKKPSYQRFDLFEADNEKVKNKVISLIDENPTLHVLLEAGNNKVIALPLEFKFGYSPSGLGSRYIHFKFNKEHGKDNLEEKVANIVKTLQEAGIDFNQDYNLNYS